MDGMRLLFESDGVMWGDSRQWCERGQESFYVENSMSFVLWSGHEALDTKDQLDSVLDFGVA